MTVFTFHLAEAPSRTTARTLLSPPSAGSVPGLWHAECMALMTLGAPVASLQRLQLRRLAMFAAWRSDDAIGAFLESSALGRVLADGWHIRLGFLRRWGLVSEFADLTFARGSSDYDGPVVAVTLARLRLPQLPRFIKWGRPVERLVRDHPATSLALASVRPPRTFSTFSIWQSAHEMSEMVWGESPVAEPTRHSAAMAELRRREFHHEFTTLRFRPLAEFGSWQGRRSFVPSQ